MNIYTQHCSRLVKPVLSHMSVKWWIITGMVQKWRCNCWYWGSHTGTHEWISSKLLSSTGRRGDGEAWEWVYRNDHSRFVEWVGEIAKGHTENFLEFCWTFCWIHHFVKFPPLSKVYFLLNFPFCWTSTYCWISHFVEFLPLSNINFLLNCQFCWLLNFQQPWPPHTNACSPTSGH